MLAGQLNKRIAIKLPTTTTDALGQEVEGVLTTVATVWAAKWNLSTKDITRQAGVTEQASAKFLIRYRAGITTNMVVQYGSDTFKIIGTEEYENGIGLFIFVRSIDG